MSLFTDIKWDGGRGLEDLDAFGIKPCIALVQSIATWVERGEDELRGDEEFSNILLLLKSRLEEVSSKIGEMLMEGGTDILKTEWEEVRKGSVKAAAAARAKSESQRPYSDKKKFPVSVAHLLPKGGEDEKV